MVAARRAERAAAWNVERLKVIAEGVENEEQLAYLREHGCDLVQGYYFSELLPVEEFSELLKKGKPLLSVSVRD